MVGLFGIVFHKRLAIISPACCHQIFCKFFGYYPLTELVFLTSSTHLSSPGASRQTAVCSGHIVTVQLRYISLPASYCDRSKWSGKSDVFHQKRQYNCLDKRSGRQGGWAWQGIAIWLVLLGLLLEQLLPSSYGVLCLGSCLAITLPLPTQTQTHTQTLLKEEYQPPGRHSSRLIFFSVISTPTPHYVFHFSSSCVGLLEGKINVA